MILTFHNKHLVFINSNVNITEDVFAEKYIFRLSLKITEISIITFKLRSRYVKAINLVLMYSYRDLIKRYYI